MPARNRIKQYIENGYYHIYNRGVEKRNIFQEDQDYGVFLSYLKEYLSPKNKEELISKLQDANTTYKEKDKILKILRMNNFNEEITLIAYSLMPNHFHFFIKQTNPLSIDKFMQSLATRYTMYFNRKYKRVGFLCQGSYKASLIETEEQFIYLSKYIHKQAVIHQGLTLRGKNQYPSSYPEYIGLRNSKWIHPEEILSYFSKVRQNLSYEAFVNEQDDLSIIQEKILEESI
ncbi:MAG: transposase [Candidatus Levybacteria bacterium]|nr:transposase [Candidatus Levybacteria bacterium]